MTNGFYTRSNFGDKSCAPRLGLEKMQHVPCPLPSKWLFVLSLTLRVPKADVKCKHLSISSQTILYIDHTYICRHDIAAKPACAKHCQVI